jgi:hypothetical protein
VYDPGTDRWSVLPAMPAVSASTCTRRPSATASTWWPDVRPTAARSRTSGGWRCSSRDGTVDHRARPARRAQRARRRAARRPRHGDRRRGGVGTHRERGGAGARHGAVGVCTPRRRAARARRWGARSSTGCSTCSAGRDPGLAAGSTLALTVPDAWGRRTPATGPALRGRAGTGTWCCSSGRRGGRWRVRHARRPGSRSRGAAERHSRVLAQAVREAPRRACASLLQYGARVRHRWR